MTTRIYLVTDTETNKHRLIRASNQAQAIKYAASTRFDIEVAGQDDLVSLLTHGIPVEPANGQATADMLKEDAFKKATVDMFEEAAITNPGETD